MDSEPRQESDSNDCFLTSDVQFGTEPINDQSEVASIEPDSGGISQAKMTGRATCSVPFLIFKDISFSEYYRSLYCGCASDVGIHVTGKCTCEHTFSL